MTHAISRSQRGFTLVELLIAVAVAAILSSIAYPAYSAVVHKARRSDAQVALLGLHMKQERYRSDHTRYGDLAEIGVAAKSPSGHYVLNVVSRDESGFDARAVATGAQSSDASCRHMKLAVDGMNVVHASGPDAALGNSPAENKRCWGL